jgi:hypothetical protein
MRHAGPATTQRAQQPKHRRDRSHPATHPGSVASERHRSPQPVGRPASALPHGDSRRRWQPRARWRNHAPLNEKAHPRFSPEPDRRQGDRTGPDVDRGQRDRAASASRGRDLGHVAASERRGRSRIRSCLARHGRLPHVRLCQTSLRRLARFDARGVSALPSTSSHQMDRRTGSGQSLGGRVGLRLAAVGIPSARRVLCTKSVPRGTRDGSNG